MLKKTASFLVFISGLAVASGALSDSSKGYKLDDDKGRAGGTTHSASNPGKDGNNGNGGGNGGHDGNGALNSGLDDDSNSAGCAKGTEGQTCYSLALNHVLPVDFGVEYNAILLGNPAIADITPLKPGKVAMLARSVGATNMVLLDAAGDVIKTYEIYVRTPENRRVTLRLAEEQVNYQCTSTNCSRALNMDDSVEPFGEQVGQIQGQRTLKQPFIQDSAANASRNAQP